MLKDKDIVCFSDIMITVSALQDALFGFSSKLPSGFTDLNGKPVTEKEIFGSLAKTICNDIIAYIDKSMKEGDSVEGSICLDKQEN